MSEPISGAFDRLTTGGGRAIMLLQAQARAVWLWAMVLRRRWLLRVTPDRGVARATNEPVSGALVKLTNESRKVILALPGHGRALVQRVPQPVQIELRKLSSRGAHVCREIFAGILVATWISIEGPLSGMSMNPARTFASALPANVWTGFWLYMIAPVAGMQAAAALFTWQRGRSAVKCSKLIHSDDQRCIHCGYQPSAPAPEARS